MQRHLIRSPEHAFERMLEIRDALASYGDPEAEHDPTRALSSESNISALNTFFELSDKRQNIEAVNSIHAFIQSAQPQASGDALVGNILTDPWAIPAGWFIRTGAVLPWQKKEIAQIWKPRLIGYITGDQTPDTFDGPKARWKQFETEQEGFTKDDGLFPGMMGSRAVPQPRIYMVNDWGSGNNRLQGLYLATHERNSLSSGFHYYAVRKINPASDPSTLISGLSPIYFEALAMNCRPVPLAIGSVDFTGTVLPLPSGYTASELGLDDQGRTQLAMHLHMNETQKRYRTWNISQKDIVDMQLASIQNVTDVQFVPNLSVSQDDAALFMKMLAFAVLQATQVSLDFKNLTDSNAFLMGLLQQARDSKDKAPKTTSKLLDLSKITQQ